MTLRRVAEATTLALVAALLVASPSQARSDPDPVAEKTPTFQFISLDDDHYPAELTTNVPPDGTSMITSPPIDNGVKTIKIGFKPKTNNIAEQEEYERFVHTLGSMTKGNRLLTCVLLYQAVFTAYSPDGKDLQANGVFATVAGAALIACLQLAGLIKREQARSSSAAAGKCGAFRPTVAASVTQDANGYTVAASGQPQKTRKPKLKTKCKVVGDTVQLTITARKKGQSLRKAAGKKLMVGLKSPSDAQTTVPVQVTFSTP